MQYLIFTFGTSLQSQLYSSLVDEEQIENTSNSLVTDTSLSNSQTITRASDAAFISKNKDGS